MLGWIFASSFVVSPSYERKKQRCFKLDMIEKTEEVSYQLQMDYIYG
jgi:hypothetical protein